MENQINFMKVIPLQFQIQGLFSLNRNACKGFIGSFKETRRTMTLLLRDAQQAEARRQRRKEEELRAPGVVKAAE